MRYNLQICLGGYNIHIRSKRIRRLIMIQRLSFDAGMIFNSIWAIINVAIIVLLIYVVILLVKYLRRGIKYYDMKLSEKKVE